MENAPSPQAPQRRPWPMRWIVVAIVTYITAYTAINVGFRKTGSAHEPWEEAQQRRDNVKQQAMLEWTRLFASVVPATTTPMSLVQPAGVTRGPATANLEKVLPIELVLVIPKRPALAPAPVGLVFPAAPKSGEPVPVMFDFTGENPKEAGAIGEFLAYARDRQLHLFLQDGSRIGPDVVVVPATGLLAVELPADGFASGTWTGMLYCSDATLTWEFNVE